MKNLKRAFVLLLAFVLLVGVFSGCSNNKPSGSPSKGGSTGNERFKTHMEISVAIWDAEKSIREDVDDAILNTILQELNITLVPVNVTYDDYVQKIQVWAASTQLPDVFAIDAVGKPFYNTWVEEELVKPLPGDLSEYPNLKTLLDGPDYQAYKWPEDDKMYCIPRPTYSSSKMWANEKALLIRKDWMEELGYSEDPDSLESMIELLDNLAKNNPEGKSNVVGATAFDSTFMCWFMWPYNVMHIMGGSDWMKLDGKWMPAIYSPQTLEGVKAMKQMWDAGVIDKDIATISGEEGLDKFASGRAAALAYGGVPTMMQIIEQKFAKNYPDKKFEDSVKLVKPYKGIDGNYWYPEATTPWSESFINAEINDEKMVRILSLFDYLLSDEGLTLLRFGIEDVDYKREGDEIVSLRDTPLLDDYPFVDNGMNFLASWDQDFSYINPNVSEYLRKEAGDIMDWYWESGKGSSEMQDFRTGFLEYPSKNKNVATAFHEDLIRAIMSPDAEKEWNSILDKYMANGYDVVIEEFNEAAKEAGILP